MTSQEYLQWIQRVSAELAERKYPNDKTLQLVYQMGMAQQALADLCYIDSDNAHKINKMLKRNINGPTRRFQAKQ